MDPFSITAGAMGIAGVATTSITQLHSLVSGLTGVEDLVQGIVSHLEGVQRSIAVLGQVKISDEATSVAAKQDLEKAGVAEAVNKCGSACDEFEKSIKRWTKHSSLEKVSLRDRFQVGIWNREKIATFRVQLQSCEAVLMLAVNSTQLLVQMRSERLSEAQRKFIGTQLECIKTRTEEQLALSKSQHSSALARIQELESLADDEDDEEERDRTLAAQTVKDRIGILEASQISYGVIFAQAETGRSGQVIGNIITDGDSRALVGLPKSVVGKINQRIGDVTTQNSSKAVVGAFDDDIDFSRM